MDRDIVFSRIYLANLRREAAKAKVKLPTKMTALKSGVGDWYLVEGRNPDGTRLAKEVCAHNAYEARTKIIEPLLKEVE